MTKQRKKPGLVADLKTIQQQMAPMMGIHYLSKRGVRISPHWWTQLYNDRTYRRIAVESVMTKIDGETRMFMVYADWHGVDDREEKVGPPMIFEIKVEDPFETWHWNAHSVETAQTVHAMVIAKLRQGISPSVLEISTPFN
jgi:hypothetical protein